MTDLPLDIEKELIRLGVIEKKPSGHAPVAWPATKPKDKFRRPIFDDNGEPDF